MFQTNPMLVCPNTQARNTDAGRGLEYKKHSLQHTVNWLFQMFQILIRETVMLSLSSSEYRESKRIAAHSPIIEVIILLHQITFMGTCSGRSVTEDIYWVQFNGAYQRIKPTLCHNLHLEQDFAATEVLEKLDRGDLPESPWELFYLEKTLKSGLFYWGIHLIEVLLNSFMEFRIQVARHMNGSKNNAT